MVLQAGGPRQRLQACLSKDTVLASKLVTGRLSPPAGCSFSSIRRTVLHILSMVLTHSPVLNLQQLNSPRNLCQHCCIGDEASHRSIQRRHKLSHHSTVTECLASDAVTKKKAFLPPDTAKEVSLREVLADIFELSLWGSLSGKYMFSLLTKVQGETDP